MRLQNTDEFNMKIFQLYDMIQVRHGLMLVGPTGGGKSSNWRCLQDACTSLREEELFEKVHDLLSSNFNSPAILHFFGMFSRRFAVKKID